MSGKQGYPTGPAGPWQMAHQPKSCVTASQEARNSKKRGLVCNTLRNGRGWLSKYRPNERQYAQETEANNPMSSVPYGPIWTVWPWKIKKTVVFTYQRPFWSFSLDWAGGNGHESRGPTEALRFDDCDEQILKYRAVLNAFESTAFGMTVRLYKLAVLQYGEVTVRQLRNLPPRTVETNKKVLLNTIITCIRNIVRSSIVFLSFTRATVLR